MCHINEHCAYLFQALILGQSTSWKLAMSSGENFRIAADTQEMARNIFKLT